jgi:hypothetical protein
MEYLEDKIRKGTIKALVREKAEDLWQMLGTIDFEDAVDIAIGHPYIRNSVENMAIASKYLMNLRETGRNTENVLRYYDAKGLFKVYFQVEPEDEVALETRPYGIHIYATPRDLYANPNELKKNKNLFRTNVAGQVMHAPIGNIEVSAGISLKSASDFMILWLEKLQADDKESKVFKKDYHFTPNEIIEADKALDRGELLDLDIINVYNYIKQYHMNINYHLKDKYRIAHHELEHIHSRLDFKGEDPESIALDELIAHLNLYVLYKGMTIPPKDTFNKCYDNSMKENFDDFYSMIEKVRNKKTFAGRNMQSRIFPMVLLEMKDFGNVKYHFDEVIERVIKLRI